MLLFKTLKRYTLKIEGLEQNQDKKTEGIKEDVMHGIRAGWMKWRRATEIVG